MGIEKNLEVIRGQIPSHVTLVAVSKTKPIEELKAAYDAGQRVFGENKVQEMTQKWELLPKDIQWHMIGHVQRNKVKYMAPFVSLIHGVDSLRLLQEIDKQAKKHQRTIPCLLQVHIAKESTKFGFDEKELRTVVASETFKSMTNISIAGLMGMATFTNNKEQIRSEFRHLKHIFTSLKEELPKIDILSMGMSGDFEMAIEEGSTMVRIGSSIFGARNY